MFNLIFCFFVISDAQAKKPPHHLRPLGSNYDDDENQEENSRSAFDPYETKKITIPLDPRTFKDKDHINVDINLRLIDLLPTHNRSMDDFNDDPLARYIKNYETNISRSLPGSSGSFNSTNGKPKLLPPLGQKYYPSVKPYSHEDPRRLLQHEYDSEIKSEGKFFS